MIEHIEVNIQNSIRINSRVGVIYVDPLEIPDERHDADYILITHDHYDHFSAEDIRKVAKSDSILVVPEKMSGKAQGVADVVRRIETVKPAVYREIDGLEFETVPAYNTLKPFHPKSAEWVGYVLRIDGKRIYIAGDTDATKEAKAVRYSHRSYRWHIYNGCQEGSGTCKYYPPRHCSAGALWELCWKDLGWRSICGECEESGEDSI